MTPKPDAADLQLIVNLVLRPICRIMSSYKLFDEANIIQATYQLSFYDSLIVADALQSNCNTLYSEDLLHDIVIDGLKIHNPFIS